MEPPSCSDEDRGSSVLDTGQSAAGAQVAVPDSPPGGSGCYQDGPKKTVESTAKALEGEAGTEQAVEAAPSDVRQHSHGGPPPEQTEAGAGDGSAFNDACVSVGCSEENAEQNELCENVMIVAPKIVIEHESVESREADSLNEDDMDPLITTEDTESQCSDLINFDTVSYDVIRQHGGEEDDDEKSITTLSSLSCDIKLDSPSKQSHSSNSSSLTNLLDFSVNEALRLAVDQSGSAPSSGSSSPSLRSAKTVSSAVDDSISEAFMNVLKLSDDEAVIVKCDNKVLSQKDLPSEDICKTENEESVIADISEDAVDDSKEPNSIEECIDVQCEELVTDSSGAPKVLSPVVENLSSIVPSQCNAASNSGCSPDHGIESNMLNQMCDDNADHNNFQPSIVPDTSVLNSPEDVKDLQEECLVDSSSKLNNIHSAADLVPEENDNIESNAVENERNSGPMSTIPTTENPANVVSELTNAVIQDLNGAVSVSSTTEDEENLLTYSYDDGVNLNLPVVSSTSCEDPSFGASVISSTSEKGENDIEEQVSSPKSAVNGSISPEENILSSTVSEGNMGEDTSDMIISSTDEPTSEKLPDSSLIIRSPSPADSALSISNGVTSGEAVEHLGCDSSNETMELTSLEATNGDLSSASDRMSVPSEHSSDLHIEADSQNVCIPVEYADKTKRPTTLPEINLSTASEKSSSMNFSEFLGLFNTSSVEETHKPKQYDVAALDEAQQMASFLVDDILQMAMIRAEEKLTASESLVEERVEAVQVAQILVDGLLTEATAHVSLLDTGTAEISTTCDIKDSEGHNSFNSLASDDLQSQASSTALTTEPCPVSQPAISESLVNVIDELSDYQKNVTSVLEDIGPTKAEQRQDVAEENLLSSNANCAEMPPSSTSDNLNNSEDNSLSDSLVDVQSKDSNQTSSTENAGADSSRSSLLTTSDQGLRSEASLFVDGVLQEAVKKYEESSSSESSPVKIRGLALDSDFFQEEEELATPCGEMLTEHFMDFESGRNVSVFCSIPENRNEDLAYDRVAHTIGNREVDSDTGKSVSVFRMEEDVFYEIQRASTCTSVFESVEEEDEDMIDTTIPVEERPEKTLSTSASFPSYDKDKFGASDDLFSADCDAFEDAVGAFLSKERLAHTELRNRGKKSQSGCQDESEQQPEVTCRALVLRHPEIGISNADEKKRMAEKWANGGESEVPDTPEMREKQRAIREALDSEDDVAVKLCRLALTEGGLINDSLRREAWPRMLGLDPTLEVNAPSLEDLKSHPEYGQVVLDVNRSLKRFPPDIPKDQRETLQDKLTRLIMYVISKHPHLRYYQGYHDVAVTFLLVVGESIAFQIMERLSTEHLSDCMQPTMERTSYLLHFIYPLLHRLHPTLADYLEKSEVGTMFCLPWFLTWFGHSLDHYKDVVRLYDHFLASPPLAPLYVAAVLVAHRADEVLAVDCDMAAIHALLSRIPDSLPLEILLRDATDLYMKFPPESIEREVEARFRNEQDMRVQEMEARERRQKRRAGAMQPYRPRHGSGSWQLAEIQDRIGGSMMVLNRWMPPWVVQQQRLSMRLLFASATFFVGFYVYSRGGDMLPYP